jgi:outer membrane receptor for ferrienterochelin and colicin
MIGFLPRRMTVDLRPHDTTRVTIAMQERVVVLDSVKVFGKARDRDWLQGFDQRKARGFGHFLTREDIEEHAVIDLTDVFRGVPGVRVQWTGSDYTLQMTRATSLSGSCPITYYIDGMPVSDFNINWLQPPDVEAIEVYQPGQAPPQFSGVTGGGCGVVVVWTRRPGGRSR